MPRKAKSYGSFGSSVSSTLAERHMTQTGLAASLDCTVAHVNNMMTNRVPASPKWADLVADVLEMSERQRKQLHAAAAVDAGYNLDLTPPKRNR